MDISNDDKCLEAGMVYKGSDALLQEAEISLTQTLPKDQANEHPQLDFGGSQAIASQCSVSHDIQ